MLILSERMTPGKGIGALPGPSPDERVRMYGCLSRPWGTPGGPLCCGSWDEDRGGLLWW